MGIGAFSRPPWFHSPEKRYGVSLSAPPIPTALRKLVREQFEDSRNILENSRKFSKFEARMGAISVPRIFQG